MPLIVILLVVGIMCLLVLGIAIEPRRGSEAKNVLQSEKICKPQNSLKKFASHRILFTQGSTQGGEQF